MTDNIISIDLESFVHIDINNNDSSNKRKKKDDGYVIRATDYILKKLKENDARATFFVVAEIYDWYPELIKKIRRNHEIGLHTYSHKKITARKIMLDELKKSSRFIEEFAPRGFRAPQAYMPKNCLNILKDYGFFYDSSSYDSMENSGFIEGVLEIPVSTYNMYGKIRKKNFPKHLSLNLMKKEIPVGSGYFIGIFGKNISFFVDSLNKRHRPYVMFMHPWQIQNPEMKKSGILKSLMKNPAMLPYYINKGHVFEYLLKKYKFMSFSDYINKNKLLKSKI